ncbi:MAG: hypothetical protein H7067_04345 [Burkholderiales bacterium]|nr:hypothetical protein [Opitutaceae bacterium]
MTERAKNRRRRLLWGAGFLGALALAGLWAWRGGVVPGAAPSLKAAARESARERAGIVAERSVAMSEASAGVASTPPPAAGVVTENPAEEEAREKIESLVVAYDASVLPRLAGYLAHPSAEVRAMAREGVVQLGATEGAAFLRAAADKATDPREAVALLDAADFLDLPPAEIAGRASRASAR